MWQGQRLFIASQTRDGDLDTFFADENQATPSSLLENGSLKLPKKKSEIYPVFLITILSLKHLKSMLKLRMVQLSLTCSNQHILKYFVTMPPTHLRHIFPVFLDRSNAQTYYGIDTLQKVRKTKRIKIVELASVERLLVIAFFQQTV